MDDRADSKLYSAFHRTEEYSPRNVAGEVTVRLPYAVYAPTIVTHIPLFQTSHKDATHRDELIHHSQESENFEQCRENITKHLLDAVERNFPKEELVDPLIKAFAAKLRMDESIVGAAIDIVWKAGIDALKLRIAAEKPELLVFDARTLINLEINRCAHNVVVENMKNPGSPWDNEYLRANAFDITNSVLFSFLNKLDHLLNSFSYDGLPKVKSRDGDQSKDSVPASRRKLRGLGGLISWFHAHDILKSEQMDGNIEGTILESWQLYATKMPAKTTNRVPIIDNYLLWRRGDKNWRYTFYEGISKYPDYADEDCACDLKKFVEKLLMSHNLASSFPDNTIIEKGDLAQYYPFPGFRIAGAQYFVLPAEILVLLVHSLPRFAQHFRLSVHRTVYASTNGMDVDACFSALYAIDDKHRPPGELPLKQLVSESEATFRGALNWISVIHEAKKIQDRIKVFYSALVGYRLREENLSSEQERFYQVFAALAELLWKSIYHKAVYRIGEDDFVSSVVIDGAALYLSNFRPFEPEKFTRTFFVDFGLRPYQRGRLVRRLCEVATYRMSCAKDVSLFNALQDGINQMNRRFTEVVSTLKIGDDKVGMEKVFADAISIYQKAMRFDMYIPDGVSARRRGVEGDWQRVRRQVFDIRERRLTGYARLRDFLERGLAVSILEINRVADRYEDVLVRLRDLMSTINTNVAGRQAKQVINTISDMRSGGRVQKRLVSAVLAFNGLGMLNSVLVGVFSDNHVPAWILGVVIGEIFALGSIFVALWLVENRREPQSENRSDVLK